MAPRLATRALVGLALALGAAACLAPPPPIVVGTPFGDVRADTPEKAREIAGLLEELAPRVRELLPGSQDRTVDVWVQNELQVYRFHKRPESVRGFTLLASEFRAKRIHLQEGGQSPWYLSHELVHALIGPSWKRLPGILEEGLGDVIAEKLNPEFAFHIRAHRLLNASALTGGFYLNVAYSAPRAGRSSREWPRYVSSTRVLTETSVPRQRLQDLFQTSRAELHRRWPELPESFYGFAWLVVARICDRGGIEALHRLCLRAEAEGLDLVPPEWIFAAADMDPEQIDADFLTSCFGPAEIHAASYLQSELFTGLALELFAPLCGDLSARQLLFRVRPAFRASDGTEVPFFRIPPLSDGIFRGWRRRS
jgi:hypothetical protein